MLPENKLSTIPIGTEFLSPDNKAFGLYEDWEKGGIAHQDPSQGINLKDWRAWKDRGSGWIYVQPVDLSQPALRIAQHPTATFISLAFDRNMRVVVAWRVGTSTYLYWFDPITNNYIITQYANTHSPRLCHDDKRERAEGWSDVLLFYVKESKVYVRTQRDRYTIEAYLGNLAQGELLYRVGMNTANRVQLEAR